MILINQYCFVSLFISCLIEQTRCLIQDVFLFPYSNYFNDFIVDLFSTATAAVFAQYSTFTGRARRCGGFPTDAILLTASCSWFCTLLLEFSSIVLCKISFSFSLNACLPFSVHKENRH